MKDLHTLVPSQVNLEINFNSNPVKALNPLVLAFVAGVRKGRGIGDAVADLWEGPGDPPTPYFRSNRGPSPFFHLLDLWRLLVFLLPLVHSLVYCLCYPTVVCSVIICSLLSQLPGNTNLSQKLRYLSSTCDVRKRRSVHEQSQEWTSVGRKKTQFPSTFSAVHFFIVNTDCTKLQFDLLFWQNAEKNSTSVSFSIRSEYITCPIHSNSGSWAWTFFKGV